MRSVFGIGMCAVGLFVFVMVLPGLAEDPVPAPAPEELAETQPASPMPTTAALEPPSLPVAPATEPATPLTAPAPPTMPAETPEAAPATQESNAAPRRVPMSQRPETIELYTNYYLELYGNHLKSGDWMARAMGVISLARIDDPRATEMLIGAMKRDPEPIIHVYAWEALHGRQNRLTPEQRKEWVRQGFLLFDRNMFRGEMRQGIVGLIEEGGPTETNRNRFLRLFGTTNCINPADIRTLHAMGDLLARWRDPVLARKMVEAMSVLNDAYRAEVVLHRVDATVPAARTMLMESSQFMWSATQKRWVDWFAKAKWKAVDPRAVPQYAGTSRIMPAGEPIRDTNDPKWRRDLELRRFRLDQLDVGICLDTTASMAAPLEWVKREVVKMMRMFDLISREPRIGITLYRDRGDKYVTRSFPMTGNADALAAMLKKETYAGGGDVPEAAYEALDEAVNKQPWSTATRAKKVVVLISDAPPQENSLAKIEELATSAASKGFIFYTVKVATSKYVENVLKLANYDKQLATFDKIAGWGNGKSVWVEFWNQSTSGRWQYASQPLNDDRSPRVIFRDVLKFVLEEGYKDRVDPFVNVLIEFIEDSPKEVRVAFEKAGPSRPGGPPSNPQTRR